LIGYIIIIAYIISNLHCRLALFIEKKTFFWSLFSRHLFKNFKIQDFEFK